MRNGRIGVCVGVIAATVAWTPLMARRSQEASPQAAGTRNGVIGTVTTPGGQPLSGAVVTLIERDTSHRAVRFHIASANAHVLSDERGQYRFENLPLGDYYVAAIPHNQTLTADRHINRSGYRISYYPSARSAAEAMAVTVGMQKAAVANIRLIPATLSVVSGTVIGQNGQPIRQGLLHIAHGDNLFGIDSMGIQIRPDGSFVLPALPPGTYFLQFRESAWPPARGEVPLISDEKVVVAERDLAGVRVAPMHMVRASGRAVIAAADRASFQASKFEVCALVTEGNPGPQMGEAVKDDLTFEFRAWPLPQFVRVLIDQVGWTVKAVRRNGVDITDTRIDFKEGQEISGIEIELQRGVPGRVGGAHPLLADDQQEQVHVR